MDPLALEIVAVKEECCGSDICRHTAIEHRDHVGYLVDGTLRCHRNDSEPLFQCCLSFDQTLKCELVRILDGHIHGPSCGHELVPHGNHLDYLVGSRLHHVVGLPEKCCEKGCLGEVVKSTVVDHGFVHLRPRAGASQPQNRNPSRALLPDEKIAETDIYAAGICCPSEVPVINKILNSLPGVVSVNVTVLTKNVHVVHDPSKTSPAVLVSALNGAGLQASIGKREKSSGSMLASLPIHVMLSGLFLAMSIVAFASSSVEWFEYFALVSVVVGCPLIVVRAIASVRRFILDINVLMLAGCFGAIALQEYYEAAAIVFLFGMSQWLEDRCMGKARNAVSGLGELQPEIAISAAGNEQIPVNKIEVDDLLIVRPGDRVPVDGVVVSGNSSLDESLLTGESKPVAKKEGDNVLSGSINSGSGSLKMRATSRVSDSTVAQLAKKVEEASMQRSATERAVETFAKFYTPVVVIAAAIAAILPLIITSLDWKAWLKTALVFLVTACPCALVISTPVTTICGISRAAQKSILIKGGTALETLSRLKAITFDKTGTLTEGHFDVVEIKTLGDMNENEILNWAASIEVHSSHPMAAAIVGSAAARGHHHGTQAVSVENIPGGGLIGLREGVCICAGNLRLMKEMGQSLGSESHYVESLERELGERGQKPCFIAVDKKVVGIIIVADRIRKTAQPALNTLRSMKLQLGLLTGDGPVAAKHVAAAVGIEANAVHASLIPEEKASILEDYRCRYGAVGHVGDGINDSLALATADVGIAMGVGGSTMAIDAADVALFSNQISSIATAIKLSQKVRNVVYQNIIFAVSVKVVVIVLAVVLEVHLWQAVMADIGSCLIVVMNGIRLLSFEREAKHHHEAHLCIGKQYEASCCTGKTEKNVQIEMKEHQHHHEHHHDGYTHNTLHHKHDVGEGSACSSQKQMLYPCDQETSGCAKKGCCSQKRIQPRNEQKSSKCAKGCCAQKTKPSTEQEMPQCAKKGCCSQKQNKCCQETSGCAKKSCCSEKRNQPLDEEKTSECAKKGCCAQKQSKCCQETSECAKKSCCSQKSTQRRDDEMSLFATEETQEEPTQQDAATKPWSSKPCCSGKKSNACCDHKATI